MKFKHLLALVSILALVATAGAQEITADPTAMLSPEAQNMVLGWLLALTKTHPALATAITILGGARLWVKPAFSFIHWIIDLTPSSDDNAVFDRLLAWFHTPIGSKVAYLLDWTLSIKVIPPAGQTEISQQKPAVSPLPSDLRHLPSDI